VQWEDGRLHLPRRWRPAAAAGVLGFALAGVALYQSHVLSPLEYQTPIAVGCGLLLALVVFAEPGNRFVGALTWRPVAALGLASYSLFLWHDPLVRWFRDQGWSHAGTSGFVFNLVVIALVSVVLSTLTYRFVEKPALARKRTWQRDAAVQAAPEPGVERDPGLRTVPAVSPAAPK
jgi:peptidoglycan/LPS O-acetylase OafA/YrhL